MKKLQNQREDYRKLAEEFVELMDKTRSESLVGLPKDYLKIHVKRTVESHFNDGNPLGGLSFEIEHDLDRLLAEADITDGAKRFTRFAFKLAYNLGCSVGTFADPLEVFGIDIADNKYGFFNPEHAADVERIRIMWLYEKFTAGYRPEFRSEGLREFVEWGV